MKKFLKWLGIIILSLAAVIAILLFVLVNRMDGRLQKIHSIAAEKIVIPNDSISLNRGKSWVADCQHCHGEALEGKKFFDDPKLGIIYSPNLTSGAGGIGKNYRDEDWIKAIRHGVKPDGKALLVMPSDNFQNFSERDLSCIIGYLKTIPPVDNAKGENKLPWLTKVLMQLGMFGVVLPAEVVDHKKEFQPDPVISSDKTYGKYMVSVLGCTTCHGQNYAGGKSPDPNSPMVPNLTAAGNLAKWSAKDFIQSLRTGITPEKKQMDDAFMPWKHVGQMNDEKLTAMYNYLRSLPKAETAK